METILQEIPSNYPRLETLKVKHDIRTSLPLPFLSLLDRNRTNSTTCHGRGLTLSVTALCHSSIHYSLHMHCRLYKLALYDCAIPTTDHTQLTTAIVSSTTITHLLFTGPSILQEWRQYFKRFLLTVLCWKLSRLTVMFLFLILSHSSVH